LCHYFVLLNYTAPNRIEDGKNVTEAWICDGIRTPIGRYGGALSGLRTDDLAAVPITALMDRQPHVDWSKVDEVIYGSANQAGEDNRNVARMAALLAGLPEEVPGITVNRLCASGMDAVGFAARGIRSGDYELAIAGGVEGMTRAPFVMPKSENAFGRANSVYDTTIGWRFVNPRMQSSYGVDSMPQTADNVALDWTISRADQDAFAARTQARYAQALEAGVFTDEIAPVSLPQRKGPAIIFDTDEHPRPGIDIEKLAKLRGINGPDHTVTAGNASGVNDGAAALLLATPDAATSQGLTPVARILGMAAAGVAPRVMGIGPVPATRRLLKRLNLTLDQMDVIELNEAFAAQALAVLRDLGIDDDDARVNPCGGAIALGHPLGMSGARLVLAAANQLRRTGGRFALCTMCVGVGQGTALVLERL
jgi:acetyl-CoA acyltransferase